MDRYQKLISEKAKKKREFFGQTFFPRTPVLLVDLSQDKISDKLQDLVEGFLDIGLNVIAVESSNQDVARIGKETKNIKYISTSDKKQAIEAADIVIAHDADVEKIWERGCVPIAELDGQRTMNYDPLKEKGNGFYFKNSTKWAIFAAVVRALETYQFPYDWENLIREILKTKS